MPIRAAASQHGAAERAQARAGRAECRAERDVPAGAERGHRGAQSLPNRQRQALVLRYYADLSEAQIAKTMGISQGAVKSHTARGMAALRAGLEQIA